jgi:phosphatidylglycerol---prolipoprotein diacylglyceryl transferase
MTVHLVFDLLAAVSALAMTLFAVRWRLAGAAGKIEHAGAGYAVSLVTGAAAGGFGAGSLNLWLSGEPAVARSIVGALAGAIIAIELFKRARGIKGSTGIIFVPAFCASAAVGRWGCFFAGLEDRTYGIATALPWGRDFGDGVLRHPVQIYESLAMAGFLAWLLNGLRKRDAFILRNGFYLMAGFYGAQRFLWEFLKPYGTLIGPFNLFHFISAGLMIYAGAMMAGARHAR